MATLNSYQLAMLDHFSNGEFRHLGDMDYRDAMEKATTDADNLLLPFLLAELEDIDELDVGINRIKSAGNQLIDLATEMEAESVGCPVVDYHGERK